MEDQKPEEYKPVLDLVKEQMEKLDTIMAKFQGLPEVQEKLRSAKSALQENEQEIMSLIDAKSFDEVISFAKELGKTIVVTRGEKGAIAVNGNDNRI